MATGVIGPDVDVEAASHWLAAQVDGVVMPSQTPLAQVAGTVAVHPNAKVKVFGTIRFKDETTQQISPVSNGRILKAIDVRTDMATDILTKENPKTGESGYFEIVVEVPQNQLSDFNETATFAPFFTFSLSSKNFRVLPEPNPYPCAEKPECGKKDWIDVIVAWKDSCSLLPCD